MARFPTRESEILALANELESGLNANAAVYPAPPSPGIELMMARSAYTTAKNAAVAAIAAAEQATADKDEVLQA